MKLLFEECKNAEAFFKMLPSDWKQSIVPYWSSYKDSSTIYTITLGGKIVAGGIVLKKLPPEASQLDSNYKYLFEKGYQYIGFLFVKPEMRKHHLGSEWLTLLKKATSKQRFWLTIEEESLKYFYEKNGFAVVDESESEPKEWVMVYK
jgi:hypothetical protein